LVGFKLNISGRDMFDDLPLEQNHPWRSNTSTSAEKESTKRHLAAKRPRSVTRGLGEGQTDMPINHHHLGEVCTTIGG
jgi:hypothetical protein